MTPTKRFDYDDFVQRFRAACARHGIDPAEGATGYQIVNMVVDDRRDRLRERLRKALHRRQMIQSDAETKWWQHPDLWLNCPPYRSETEQQAVWNTFTQAYERAGQRQCLRRRNLRDEFAVRQRRQGGP